MESVTIELAQTLKEPKQLLIEHFQLVRSFVYKMSVGAWTYKVDTQSGEFKKECENGSEVYFTSLNDCVQSALSEEIAFRQPIEITSVETTANEGFEVLENHKISDCNYDDLILSGSLLSYMVFENVTFKNCTFFASRIENCQFFNCRFENCKIQFTHIIHGLFSQCYFEGTFWEITPIKKCLFNQCVIDAKTKYFIKKSHDNIIKDLQGRIGQITQLEVMDDSLDGFNTKEYLDAA